MTVIEHTWPYICLIPCSTPCHTRSSKAITPCQRVASEQQRIAVEIKSFSGLSDMADLEKAVGQYAVYSAVMTKTEPERTLYLAVDQEAYVDIFDEPLGQLLIETYRLQLVVFDEQQEVIIRWIP